MFDGLFIVSLIGTCVQAIKEACTSQIPVENKKYDYAEPHKDPVNGEIIIENSLLYYDDIKEYGAYQAQQWVNQGKYNLTPEDLKKEEERIKAKYERLLNL